MAGRKNSPRGFEVLKVGQTVNVLNMLASGRYILEGRATVLGLCEGYERRAVVRFLDDAEYMDNYERYIDPRAQGPAGQVEAWLEVLNRREPAAGKEDVDAFDMAFDLDATVPGGQGEGGRTMTGMSGKLANARVPGWLAIVSVAVAVLAGAGVGKLYAEKQASAALARSVAEGRLERLDRDTVTLTATAKEFVDAVLDEESGSVETRRDRLTTHIAAMHARVRVNGGWFDRPTAFAAAAYQERMLLFREAVLEVDGVMTMKPFWESASALTVAQKVFLEEMNRQLSGGPGCGEASGRQA